MNLRDKMCGVREGWFQEHDPVLLLINSGAQQSSNEGPAFPGTTEIGLPLAAPANHCEPAPSHRDYLNTRHLSSKVSTLCV